MSGRYALDQPRARAAGESRSELRWGNMRHAYVNLIARAGAIGRLGGGSGAGATARNPINIVTSKSFVIGQPERPCRPVGKNMPNVLLTPMRNCD